MSDFELALNDVEFDELGRVRITDPLIKTKLEELFAANSSVEAASNSGCNSGCGNTGNAPTCGTANAGCSEAFELADLDWEPDLGGGPGVLVNHPDFAKAILDAKIARDDKITLSLD